MKITSILQAEHAVFHNLFDYIERTSPTVRTVAEIKSLARLTESLLAAHSRTEDELFIEPLEHCFEQVGQRETFHDEHEAIDLALATVQKAREVKTAQATARGGPGGAETFRQGRANRVPDGGTGVEGENADRSRRAVV
jgi:hypothetical protein